MGRPALGRPRPSPGTSSGNLSPALMGLRRLGTHLLRASQALGPTGGVSFLALALPTATAVRHPEAAGPRASQRWARRAGRFWGEGRMRRQEPSTADCHQRGGEGTPALPPGLCPQCSLRQAHCPHTFPS